MGGSASKPDFAELINDSVVQWGRELKWAFVRYLLKQFYNPQDAVKYYRDAMSRPVNFDSHLVIKAYIEASSREDILLSLIAFYRSAAAALDDDSFIRVLLKSEDALKTLANQILDDVQGPTAQITGKKRTLGRARAPRFDVRTLDAPIDQYEAYRDVVGFEELWKLVAGDKEISFDYFRLKLNARNVFDTGVNYTSLNTILDEMKQEANKRARVASDSQQDGSEPGEESPSEEGSQHDGSGDPQGSESSGEDGSQQQEESAQRDEPEPEDDPLFGEEEGGFVIPDVRDLLHSEARYRSDSDELGISISIVRRKIAEAQVADPNHMLPTYRAWLQSLLSDDADQRQHTADTVMFIYYSEVKNEDTDEDSSSEEEDYEEENFLGEARDLLEQQDKANGTALLRWFDSLPRQQQLEQAEYLLTEADGKDII